MCNQLEIEKYKSYNFLPIYDVACKRSSIARTDFNILSAKYGFHKNRNSEERLINEKTK